MKYLEVLVNLPLMQSFTYKNLEQSDKNFSIVDVGYRVEVLFKNRKMIACVIDVYDELPQKCFKYKDKIKKINRIIDSQPLFTKEQIELANWISKFYLCSFGESLFAMLPSGKKEISFSSSFEKDCISLKKPILSEEQNTAIQKILSTSGKNFYHYLYGQTGSGKTEVFLNCAENILKEGKGVIYLVPEISLTHQVIESVVKRFGSTTAVLHSGLTGSQKFCEWHRILKKEARVIIGARSAIFAPVPDLGLIIIDEEHDSSYKSGTTPRYHARQVAMKRSNDLKIPLVMGSATPSVEAWKLMSDGILEKHSLTKRLAGGKMPEIQTVDLTKVDDKGRKTQGSISPALEDEIRNTIKQNKQTILFLNRRGFSHFFKCNSCGFELKCKNCSVSMTYHKNKNQLICHYCGWSIPLQNKCPECNSYDVGYYGFGTEFIESEVKAKFPQARIDRIDTDNLKNQDELKQKLNDFKEGKIDILLGTQMVAKGLNFPNLKLVGIISADTGLHLPDFRAAERTFSLIVQVAGRAGRFFPDGKVIVQSYAPERNVIYYACNNDLDSFYKYELFQRELLSFPPYSRLIRLVFRSSIQSEAEQSCRQATEIFKNFISSKKQNSTEASIENKINEVSENLEYEKDFDFDILGPSECPIAKISANYRYQIILKCKKLSIIQMAVSKFIYEYKNTRPVYIEIDVDPANLL